MCDNAPMMMKNEKAIVTRSVSRFAEVMGLSQLNVREIKIRRKLNSKIIEVVKQKKLSTARVAMLADTYSTSVVEILNQNIQDIPTNLMLRILVSLGVRAKTQFKPAA